jgi:hypothetical protein
MKLRLLLLSFVLLFSGCATDNFLFVSKSAKEKEIAALRVDFDNKIKAKEVEVSEAKDKVIQNQDSQLDAASNSFYAADLAFDTIISPNRTDLIINNYILEGWSATGNRVPSYKVMAAINDRLKKELNERETSLADLKKTHEAALGENTKLADASKAAKEKIELLEKEKQDIKIEFASKLDQKQTELNEANGKIINEQKKQVAQAKSIEAAKTKISLVAGIVALACLAGAIYSPIGKQGLALIAGVCGLVSVGIFYLEAWMVLVAALLVAAGVVIWFLRTHQMETKVGDSLVLAMEDVKNESKELWDKISPKIKERLKKYTKKDGKIVAVEDPKTEAFIDKKLSEWDAK